MAGAAAFLKGGGGGGGGVEGGVSDDELTLASMQQKTNVCNGFELECKEDKTL